MGVWQRLLIVGGFWAWACGAGSVAAQSDTLVHDPVAAPVGREPGGRETGAAAPGGVSAEATTTIPPEEAASRAGKACTVEMTVRSSRHLDDKEMCFLNSSKQHRDADNFTVVIFKTGLERLTEAGIEAPAEHFSGRTIRVRGVVQLRNEKPQIVVESPTQIELVEEDGSATRN